MSVLCGMQQRGPSNPPTLSLKFIPDGSDPMGSLLPLIVGEIPEPLCPASFVSWTNGKNALEKNVGLCWWQKLPVSPCDPGQRVGCSDHKTYPSFEGKKEIATTILDMSVS